MYDYIQILETLQCEGTCLEEWCQHYVGVSFFSLPFDYNWLCIHNWKKNQCLCTAYQDVLEIHPSVHLKVNGLDCGGGDRARKVSGELVWQRRWWQRRLWLVWQWGSRTFLTEELEGEGGEWGSTWPCVLQLEGPVAFSEERPHWLQEGKNGK